MNREEAFNVFYKFMYEKLNARKYHNNYFSIDGTKVCQECKNHRVNPVYIRCTPDMPLYLKCFRAGCTNSRRLTEKDLIDMGFMDKAVIRELIKDVKTRDYNFETGYFEILSIDYSKMTDSQYVYMMDRCKIQLTKESMFEYKIIPDFKDTLKISKYINIDAEKYSLSPKNTICFYSDNENKFMFRGINRDFKLILTADKDMVGNYYTLNIGKMNKKIMFVCEGVFDCINVFNMNRNIDKDALFVATFGFASYIKAIEYYYQKYIDTLEHIVLVMDTVEVSKGVFIYPLTDVKTLISQLEARLGKRFVKKIDVIYNSSSKDFGDFTKPISTELDKIYEGGKYYI